jgi:tetratricopeptide (TPR) repeat protein
LCLDDLQWADASTLLLLEHVARRLAAAPFLLVATYRDVSLSEMPRLAGSLERLLRERLSHTLSLAPLDVDEVGLMLEDLGGSAPPREVVKAFHHATEGNALFVEEVFQFLLQRGLLFQPSGEWSHDVSLYGDEVPQGIRLVIGSRLRQLGEDCRRVLVAGAAIGRTFRYELLRAITDLDEEVIFDAIEVAQRSHVLATAPGGPELSFSHDLIRQTLLSELSLPRKQRLHGRIAEAIEEAYTPDIEPYLAELTTHCRLANVPSALHKAIGYGVRAAEQASRAFAYREAAGLYEQALEALELVEPNNAGRQCDLLLALGGVLLPEGESARVLDSVIRRALNIGKRLEDGERTRLACRLAMEALSRRGMRMVTLTDEWRQWAAEYDQYAGNDTVDRVRLDIDSAERLHMTGHEAEARHRRSSALELARRLGGRDEILYAASFCMYYTQAPSYQQERIRLAEAAAGWPVQGASARTLAFFYLYMGWVYWDWGRRSEAQAAWRCLHDLPNVSPDNFATFFSFFAEGCAAAIEGRLEEVVRLAYGAIPTGDRLGSPVVGQMSAALIAYRPLLHLGRYEEAMRLMESAWRGVGLQEEPAYFKPRRLLALANLGRHSEARRLLQQVLDERGIGPEDDGNGAVADLLPLLESSVLLKDETAAAILCGRLESVAGLIESHVGTNTSVGRHLGDAAVLLADNAQARRRYAQALETCESVRFRPEVALIRLSLGELLARSPGERAASADHLDYAESEFRKMTMTHALDRVRAARARW